MNRSFRDSMFGGGKCFPVASQPRRGRSVNVASNQDSPDDSLDLFSRTRRSVSVVTSDDSDVSVKLGRISVGSADSAKVGKIGLEDLISSTVGGKHDYDWLLAPPETPLVPPLIGNGSQLVQTGPRSRSLARSVATSKASRPARSSSVTRSSISNILNTSSASVSSYIRPSRPTISRPSTPSKPRPSSRPQAPATLPNRPLSAGKLPVASMAFGRTVPKKKGPLSGSTRFPHSAKSHSHSASSPASLNHVSEKGSEEDDGSRLSARVTNADIFDSCRYDMIILKEDAKNTNWLHSIDDHATIFESGFECLPEPFDHMDEASKFISERL